jgi:hypothetical protein
LVFAIGFSHAEGPAGAGPICLAVLVLLAGLVLPALLATLARLLRLLTGVLARVLLAAVLATLVRIVLVLLIAHVFLLGIWDALDNRAGMRMFRTEFI